MYSRMENTKHSCEQISLNNLALKKCRGTASEIPNRVYMYIESAEPAIGTGRPRLE